MGSGFVCRIYVSSMANEQRNAVAKLTQILGGTLVFE
jgi:hypothetical protein